MVCRLHAVPLPDLLPGGFAQNLCHTRDRGSRLGYCAWRGRDRQLDLARELAADLQPIDAQRLEVKTTPDQGGGSDKTTATEIHGVGPVIAAHHPRRRRRHAPLPQPRSLRRLQRHRPDRGVLRQPQDPPAVAARQPAHSTTPSTWPRSPRSGTPRHRRPRLLRPQARRRQDRQGARSARLKRQISDAIYARLVDDRQAAAATARAREGNRGTTLHPARPAHTPNAGSSDKPLPGPTSLEPTTRHRSPPDREERPSVGLDIKRPRYRAGPSGVFAAQINLSVPAGHRRRVVGPTTGTDLPNCARSDEWSCMVRHHDHGAIWGHGPWRAIVARRLRRRVGRQSTESGALARECRHGMRTRM